MHIGLNPHTQASVHFGRAKEVVSTRQGVMDEAYAAHPERFPKGKPLVHANPPVVGINPHLKAVHMASKESQAGQEERIPEALYRAGILH